MTDAKQSSFTSVAPTDTSRFAGLSATPENVNFTGTALKAYLKTYFDTLYWGSALLTHVTADQSWTSNTTLANITGLSFALEASGSYSFEAKLQVSDAATPGIKIAISAGGSALTATYIRYTTEFLAAAALATVTSTALEEAEGNAAAHTLVRITGFIKVNVAGNLVVQAAQQVSNATATIVKQGSTFEIRKVG